MLHSFFKSSARWRGLLLNHIGSLRRYHGRNFYLQWVVVVVSTPSRVINCDGSCANNRWGEIIFRILLVECFICHHFTSKVLLLAGLILVLSLNEFLELNLLQFNLKSLETPRGFLCVWIWEKINELKSLQTRSKIEHWHFIHWHGHWPPSSSTW